MEASILVRLVDQLSGPAQKIRKSLKNIGEAAAEAKKGFAGAIKQGFSIDNIEQATKSAEAKLNKARQKLLGAAAMGAAIIAPAKMAAEFSAQMANVSTLIDTNVESMEKMKEKVLDIGDRTPVALADLTGSLYDIRSAGIAAGDAMGVLEGSARLGVAGLGSTADATDLVTSSINAFNLKGDAQAKIYDIIFKAVKNGKTTITELSQGFGAVAGTVANANIQMDEYMASVAALTTTGMPAAQAHTQIRAAIVGLTRDTKETDAVFKQLHVKNFKELIDKSGGMVGAFSKIRDVLGGDDAAMQQLFGSAEAVNAVLGLTGAQAEVFNNALDDMRNGANAVDEAFNKQAEEADKKFQMLRNQMRHVAITIGNELLPIMIDLMKTVTPVIHDIIEWTKANPELTSTLVKGAAAILAMNVAMRLLSFAVAATRLPLIGLAATFLKFDENGKNIAKGWRLLAGAGRLLGGSLSLLAAAGPLVVSGLSGLGAILAGIGVAIAGVTAPVWGLIAVVVAALAAIGFGIYKYWDHISAFLSGFGSAFADAFSSILDGVAGIADQVFDWFAKILHIPPEQVAAFKASAQAAFKSAFDFSGIFDGVMQKLSNAWQSIKSFFSAEKLTGDQKAGYEQAGRALGQSIINGIKKGAEAIWDWFASWPEMIKSAIGSIDLSSMFKKPEWLDKLLGLVGAGSKDGTASKTADIGPPLNGIKPAPDAGGGWFSNLFGGLNSDLNGAGDALTNGGKTGGDAIAKGGQDAAAALRQAARDIGAAAGSLRNTAAASRPASGGGLAPAKSAALYDGGDE